MALINVNENEYLGLLVRTRSLGVDKSDRTGTGTYSRFAEHLEVDLQRGFPLLTTKYVNHRAVFAELCWMLRGETNVNQLYDEAGQHVGIWDAWADEDGELGPVYGFQWRGWESDAFSDGPVDQLAELERRLHKDPDDRRMLVSAWNVSDLLCMRLPPCHLLFQVYTHVGEDGQRRLSMHVYQRSVDLFIGLPFNMASYAALAHLLAARASMVPDRLVFSFGDAHVYQNHLDVVDEQLRRAPYRPPELQLNLVPGYQYPQRSLDALARNPGIFSVTGYWHRPALRAPVAV